VQQHVNASEEVLARALGVSARTLGRERQAGTLTTAESDRLVLLAEIVRLAAQALDGMEPAREWLSAPHSMLGGESPLEHMDTITGMDEVRTMLYQIEYASEHPGVAALENWSGWAATSGPAKAATSCCH